MCNATCYTSPCSRGIRVDRFRESRYMKLIIPTIRYYMALRGMESDADLARSAQWSKAKTSRILSGRQGVKDVIVKELAAALGCKEGEIVELGDLAQTPFERAVLMATKHADEHVKAAIHALLKIPSDIPPD